MNKDSNQNISREYYLKRVQEILNDVPYLTLATADEQGHPWNSPVFGVYDTTFNFFWSSSPDSQHSRNIQANGRLFIVVYNSRAQEGAGDGVYVQATASVVTDEEEIKHALGLLGRRRGKPFDHPEKFSVSGPQRIYKAVPQKIWMNDADQDSDGDFIRDYRVELLLKNLQQN